MNLGIGLSKEVTVAKYAWVLNVFAAPKFLGELTPLHIFKG